MSSVTSCVGGGLFICFTCLHVPYSTVTLITECSGADALAGPAGVHTTWCARLGSEHCSCI
jgi:hypothetical protein